MGELSGFELAIIIILGALFFVFVLPKLKWGFWRGIEE